MRIPVRGRAAAPVLATLALLALALPAHAQFPGKVLHSQKISSTEGNFVGPLTDEGLWGVSIARIGDLDGDGVVDIASGAYLDDDGGPDRGAVWILFLNADGTVKAQQKISSTQGGFAGPLHDVDLFGWSVESLGDLDGDGTPDIAVGAWLDDDGGVDSDHGAVWILFLKPDGTVKAQQKISATQGGFTWPLKEGDRLGTSLSALGDLDGDGVTELSVGSLYDDDGGYDSGAVYILFLRPSGTVKHLQKISALYGNFAGPLHIDDRFGYASAPLRDFDGDGVPDIAVGAFLDADGGVQHGAVWMLMLNKDGTVKHQQKISSLQGGFTGQLDDLDTFGRSVACLGDLDHDGVKDIAVGAGGDDDGGESCGAVWILFLHADGTVKSYQKISATEGAFTGHLDETDDFGQSVETLGDLDGDGVTDIGVGALLDDDGGPDRGAVWILSLSDGTWNNLGSALAGTHGEPQLSGKGPLTALAPTTLTLQHALAGTAGVLAVGFAPLDAPFKGGIFVPDIGPPGFALPITTPPAGSLVLATSWPDGIPPGITFWFQVWLADPAGPHSAAASNAITGTSH